MKKLIFSVFFLFGLISFSSSLMAQTSRVTADGGFEYGLTAQDFKPATEINQNIRPTLAQFQAAHNSLNDQFAKKQMFLQIMLYKTYTGLINDGKSAEVAYQEVAQEFDNSYTGSAKIQVVSAFNNFVLK